MGSILRLARKATFHYRSKDFRRYVRIPVLLLSLTFTALLCIAVDVRDTEMSSNNAMRGVDDGIQDTESLETFRTADRMYPRHMNSINQKQESGRVANFNSHPQPNAHSSMKTLSQHQQMRTNSLKKVPIKGIQVEIREKHLSTSLSDAQSDQTLPRKSEQTERGGLSVARGNDLDGLRNSLPMNRLSSAPIEQPKYKSARKHTRIHSRKHLSSFLKTMRYEKALSNTSDVGIQKQRGMIVDGILWGRKAEELVPEGLKSDRWSEKARSSIIVNVTSGCGRMQNRLVITEDGTKMCARYRMNKDQIQGEVFSYYLSLVLRIKNVPPLVLRSVDYKSPQWQSVRGKIQDAGWKEDKLVILSQWVPELEPVYIPFEFRHEQNRLDPSAIVNRTYTEISELVQWSDMVIFDYLTANLDRLTNNMFNRQWNNLIMDSPVHNLAKSKQLLIFFDNESGLLHSYRLLDKFNKFHKEILQSLCIFRPQTVKIIEKLHRDKNISDKITAEYKANEPLHGSLVGLPKQNVDILNGKITDVYKQIQFCRQLNSHAH